MITTEQQQSDEMREDARAMLRHMRGLTNKRSACKWLTTLLQVAREDSRTDDLAKFVSVTSEMDNLVALGTSLIARDAADADSIRNGVYVHMHDTGNPVA